MSMKKSIQLFTLFSASLLLTACGSEVKPVEPSPSKHSRQVTVPSSSKTATSSSQSSASSDSVRPAPSSNKTTQPSSSPSSAIVQEAPKTESSQALKTTDVSQLNLTAMMQGDFSSLAGTWVNGKGQSVTIDSHGVVTSFDASHEVSPWTINPDTGMISANVWLKPGGAGVGIKVLPAGKAAVVRDHNGNSIVVEMTLDERDHIEIGQDWAKPDERYYRQ